jgi:hypothetical protein
MLIRFIKHGVANAKRSFAIGDEAEFTESEAEALIAKGYAEPAEQAPETPEERAARIAQEQEPLATPKRRGKGIKQ